MKHSIIVSILALAITATAASPALAKTIPVPNTEITIFAPDDFQLAGNDELMTAESADDTATFLWASTSAKDLDKAMAGLDALLGKLVTDVKPAKAAKKNINGLPAAIFTATGTRIDNKKPVHLMVMLVQHAEGKVLIVVGGVDSAKKAAHKATFEKVFGGVRKK